MSDRYAISGPEGEYEPGSDGTVLRNLLGITDPEEMEVAESVALVEATGQIYDAETLTVAFTASDIRYLHKLWLGNIYRGPARTAA